MNYLEAEFHDLLREDARIFDFLENTSLDGLWFRDLEHPDQQWMNGRFWRTLGYDPETMPHLASAWQEIVSPKDLALARQKMKEHLATPGSVYDQIVRYRHKDGHTAFIRCKGIAIRDEHGKPIRMLGTHTDLTAEMKKKNLLRRSQEVARLGGWTVDLKAGVVYWDTVTRMIHEVPDNFVPDLQNGINFYKEGSSRETIKKLVGAAIHEGKEYDTELQLVTATGREIWVRSIGYPEFEDGECVRLTGTFQDIDARRRSEERMLTYSILEAKSKEMEQFAYIASHDLREPLLTIIGYLEVIREDYGDKVPQEVHELMNTVDEATNRMDVLIKGLLDYSRLSQIKQLQETDLGEILQNVLLDLNSVTKGLKVHFTYHELPVVMGYPLELKVLLQNLISNAVKYRQVDRPLRIDILSNTTSSGWKLSVRDNGIGIAKKDLQNIFQLFRRLHGQGTFSGNGLGLANCKKIVELHGGQIWAESELGEGSVFHFTINTRDQQEKKQTK